MKNMKSEVVCVVGQGYVGLPLTQAAVTAGYTTIGFDTNRDKIERIMDGKSPIEDVTDDDIIEMGAGYFPAHSLKDGIERVNAWPDIWVVTVPTPLDETGRPDLTFVIAAGAEIAPYIKPGALVILESTVAPGTTEKTFKRAIKHAVPMADFHLAYSPERIDPGNKRFTFINTPKLVAGETDEALQKVKTFYDSIMMETRLNGGPTVPVPSIRIAEAAKLLENIYRYVNIALVNELAQHFHKMDIDVWEVIRAAATKPYGFQAFWPGPGVGGYCLPIDPAYLGEAVKDATGSDFRFVELAMRVNADQPRYVVQRAQEVLNSFSQSVRGRTVLILGYTYKPDTADSRDTPVAEVVMHLEAMGADVLVYDPYIPGDGHLFLDNMPSPTMMQAGYDLAIVCTHHTMFSSIGAYHDLVTSGIPVLDTRNVVPDTFTGSNRLFRL